jgi:release factor glutamine methyltransferase
VASDRTWRHLRDGARDRLEEAGVTEVAQELRWIVEQASGMPAAEQSAALDAIADERHADGFEAMVGRREAGEPLQYVLGRWGFRTLDLLVDRRVLIPRPETEVVAGLAIDAVTRMDGDRVVVDLGTGSGAIALSVAAECGPAVAVWGTDASADALAVARANLAGLGRRATVVRLVDGDWFAALPDELRGQVDVLVSNPPYIADGDELPKAVERWEPAAALRAGPDGLDHLRRIVAGALDWLSPRGVLVLEIGETQGAAVTDLARAAGLDEVAVHPDLAGRDRAVVARRTGA